MDITTTVGSSAFAKPSVAGLSARLASVTGRSLRRLLRTPVLLWSLVVAAALMAFFVHLLNEQVLRGQMLREEQRAAAMRPVSRAAAQPPGNLLIVSRQPVTRP